MANEEKKWDREGTFYQQKKKKKKEKKPPFSLSPHFLRILLMQVFLQPLLQILLSLLVKGYAVCLLFTDKEKNSEFLSLRDKQDRGKPQREMQSIIVTKTQHHHTRRTAWYRGGPDLDPSSSITALNSERRSTVEHSVGEFSSNPHGMLRSEALSGSRLPAYRGKIP